MKTKRRIVEMAIQLFNEFGFANVSLPQLAKALDISLGNLTYHFPKKDQLVSRMYTLFQTELAQITRNYTTLLDIGEMDRQLREFYRLQQRFRFLYLDLLELERAYPKLAARHFEHIEGQLEGLFKSFKHNVELGYLKPGEEEQYRHLARHFWMASAFWVFQIAVRGKKGSLKAFTTDVWSTVQPFLTDLGKSTFQRIFYKSN